MTTGGSLPLARSDDRMADRPTAHCRPTAALIEMLWDGQGGRGVELHVLEHRVADRDAGARPPAAGRPCHGGRLLVGGGGRRRWPVVVVAVAEVVVAGTVVVVVDGGGRGGQRRRPVTWTVVSWSRPLNATARARPGAARDQTAAGRPTDARVAHSRSPT